MIASVIKSLERAKLILDDIPKNIEKEKTRTLSTMNDIFEDYYDKFSEDEVGRKKLMALKREIMNHLDRFCTDICAGVEEDVRIVEE